MKESIQVKEMGKKNLRKMGHDQPLMIEKKKKEWRGKMER